MKAALLYRIATVVLILFAAGHTYGFLHFTPSTAAGLQVRDAMKTPIPQGDHTVSYEGFYVGFGLSCSISTLLSAYLAWHLAWLANTEPASIGKLGWVFAASQCAGVVLGWIYFPGVPAMFATVLTLIVVLAAWRVGKHETSPGLSAVSRA